MCRLDFDCRWTNVFTRLCVPAVVGPDVLLQVRTCRAPLKIISFVSEILKCTRLGHDSSVFASRSFVRTVIAIRSRSMVRQCAIGIQDSSLEVLPLDWSNLHQLMRNGTSVSRICGVMSEHCNTMPPRNGRHSPRRPQGVNPTDNRNFDSEFVTCIPDSGAVQSS